MFIATELGKLPSEVDAMSCEDYDRLVVFYSWKKREEEANYKKAQRNRSR